MKRITTCIIIAVCLMCLISPIYAVAAANGFLWAKTKTIITELTKGGILPTAPTIFPTDEQEDIPSDEPESHADDTTPVEENAPDEEPSTPSDLITDEQTAPVEENSEDSEVKD